MGYTEAPIAQIPLFPRLIPSTYEKTPGPSGVTQILEEGQITLGENEQLYQVMLVELLEGEYKGRVS